MAEAVAAAQAAGEILVSRYGSHPWILQVMDAVQNAVQIGIENLSSSSIDSNAHPGDAYRFNARTKEELVQSQGLVADGGSVNRMAKFSQLKDPASQHLGSPAWEDGEDDGKRGLIIPAGAEAQDRPSSRDGTRTIGRHDDDPMPWML